MGGVLSRIMQNSSASHAHHLSSSGSDTSASLGFSSDSKRNNQQNGKEMRVKSESEEMASCSYHSPSQDDSTSTSDSHQESRTESMSSMSSSAMDCVTSKSSTSNPGNRPAQTEQMATELPLQLGHAPSTSSQATTNHVADVKEKRIGRPIKSRYDRLAADVHKCSSEPLASANNGTRITRRTASDIPVSAVSASGIKVATEALKPNATESIKHMEGSHTLQLNQPKSAAPAVEIGDFDSSCLEPVTLHHHEYPAEATPISSGEASQQQESTSSAVTPPTVKREASAATLIRNMEHVATVMKKKIFPPLFEANKSVFIDKILPTSQVQYGYQGDRYITVGSGEFGEVLYGRLKDSGLLVAIKALKKAKTDMYALLQEAFLLQIASTTGYAAHYRGLAPFCAFGSSYLEWAIICDFVGVPSGPDPYDFRQTLKQARSAPRTIQLALNWILTCNKIVFAVKQFHAMDMLLNDIKADNILLRPTGAGTYDPVFVDFGLASIGEGITLALEVNDSNRAKILKEYSHIAPEVLFGGETNVASDVFSLGKALSLVSEAFPIEAFTSTISRCTLWNVAQRPSIDELISNFHWLSNGILSSR